MPVGGLVPSSTTCGKYGIVLVNFAVVHQSIEFQPRVYSCMPRMAGAGLGLANAVLDGL